MPKTQKAESSASRWRALVTSPLYRPCTVATIASPTPYPELNAVLAELVAGARAVLEDSFCGAYLHGSFGSGDADEFSDVDFVVVTHDELTLDQQQGLQALHRRLYALEAAWAQHLEGSYIPSAHLRHVDVSHRTFFYLNNGAQELVWDSHCNTAVVRWLLREHGVALAGPGPRTLVDPVSAGDLQQEAATRVQDYADWAAESTDAEPMDRWKQTYLVLTFCRLLFTLRNGRVASKREAAEWALGALDYEWAALIQQALDDRADPWDRVHQPAPRELGNRTLQFAAYATATAARLG